MQSACYSGLPKHGDPMAYLLRSCYLDAVFNTESTDSTDSTEEWKRKCLLRCIQAKKNTMIALCTELFEKKKDLFFAGKPYDI